MQHDNVVPLHPHGECLSLLAVALLGAEERAPSTHEIAHLHGCKRCQTRLLNERRAVQKASNAPIPPAITAAAARLKRPWNTLPRLRWPAFAAGAMASTLAAGLLIAVHNGPTTLPQASTAAQVNAIIRDTEGRERPLQQLKELNTMHSGEQVRLQVRWPAPVRARLEDSVTGAVFFDGPLPASGWLPVAVEAPGAPLRLRIFPRAKNEAIWSQTLGVTD